MDARSFFEVTMPYFIMRSLFVFLYTKGCIHFSIEGEGSWTLELGNIQQPVAPGLLGKPDLEVHFTTGAFKAFVTGTLDPRPAIRSGEFRAEGDLQLLEHLGALLAAPKSPFRARVGLA